MTFYSGETTETYGNYVLIYKSDNDDDGWELVAAVKKEGRFRCYDPVLRIDPTGRLWLVWNVMPGEEVLAVICNDPDADDPVRSEELPMIATIKKHIEEHLCEELRVAELAEVLKISVYYLCHMFKAATWITVTDYCNSLRITKAKQLLIGTEESINGIAQRCGFCTAAYFAEIFSRSESISPTEYRRIHKKY